MLESFALSSSFPFDVCLAMSDPIQIEPQLGARIGYLAGLAAIITSVAAGARAIYKAGERKKEIDNLSRESRELTGWKNRVDTRLTQVDTRFAKIEGKIGNLILFLLGGAERDPVRIEEPDDFILSWERSRRIDWRIFLGQG